MKATLVQFNDGLYGIRRRRGLFWPSFEFLDRDRYYWWFSEDNVRRHSHMSLARAKQLMANGAKYPDYGTVVESEQSLKEAFEKGWR